jgi:hypothetical protein
MVCLLVPVHPSISPDWGRQTSPGRWMCPEGISRRIYLYFDIIRSSRSEVKFTVGKDIG